MEMEVLRSLLNPEEMDDTELFKDLSSLGKPPSFEGKDTMLINTTVDTRETSILQTSGQNYRKEILPLVNTSSLAVCRRFSTLTKLLMVCCGTATSFAENH